MCKKHLNLPILLITLLLISSCSLQKLAIRSTAGLLDASFTSLMAEDDLTLARTAIESDLKLLEGIIQTDPKNERLLLLAAMGFASYSLAFVEDENHERAARLYFRSREYANRWLIQKTGINFLAIDRLDEFQEKVTKLPDKAAPGCFWLGNSWSSALNLNLDNVAAIADFPKVEALMAFVLNTDEMYYYATVHLFFASYYGGKPRLFGGDPEKARRHFQRHRELTGGSFLLSEFFKVKYVDLPALDEESARTSLQRILDFNLDSAPEIRLINRVAQKKAMYLLEHLEEYL